MVMDFTMLSYIYPRDGLENCTEVGGGAVTTLSLASLPGVDIYLYLLREQQEGCGYLEGSSSFSYWQSAISYEVMRYHHYHHDGDEGC